MIFNQIFLLNKIVLERIPIGLTKSIQTMTHLLKTDNIIKSLEDKRLYRGLELPNKLKVLLISDETTEKAAAALEVSVGSLSEPDQLQGLAHFCEHMLFLGTEKYPKENEYSSYLSNHGGSSNACTGPDFTRYYFDIIPEFMPGALDRFAQFFISPLFTESATNREINAVNSEHEKNIPNDAWRLGRLQNHLSKPGHPFRKFGTGNTETLDTIPKSLGINVRNELLEFHSRWYSSNIMMLSVLGKESLDELEAMISPVFSQVINKNVQRPEWLDHPYGPQQLNKIVYIPPITDTRTINISFPLPDYQKFYKARPGSYISHLVGHEGPGSILSALKERGWCNLLYCGCKAPARGFSFFNLSVDLTVEGLDHVDDIIALFFQYLNMLRKEELQEWIFRECQQLNNIIFRFKDKETSMNYVQSTVKSLSKYPLEEVLEGPFAMSEFRPDLIKEILDLLVPSNICVGVMSQKFESITDAEEKYYGTKYKASDIDRATIEKWENCGTCPELFLPKPNIYIPTNFDILPIEDTKAKYPTIIYNSDLSRLWFKQDDVFGLPKADVQFEIFSPFAFLDPLYASLTQIFTHLLKDELNETSYDASLASLDWNITNNKYGFDLGVQGFNHKLKHLFDTIVDKIVNFKVNEKRFEIYKEAYVRDLKNFEMKSPYQQSPQYLSYLLAQHSWIPSEFLEFAEKMTPRDLTGLIPLLLSRIHIEGLIHGNFTKDEALALGQSFEEKLSKNLSMLPLKPQQLLRGREINLGNDAHFIYEARNKAHKSSCIFSYFQCGEHNTQSAMELQLLNKIVQQPCFDVLRTKEQLGYIVGCNAKVGNGVVGWRVIVQSDKHPDYLLTRIEAFLVKAGQILSEMTTEEYEEHRQALVALMLEKPKKLQTQTKRYWAEISAQQYYFDRLDTEVAYLKTIEKEQLLNFFNSYIAPHAPKRNRLTVYIVSDAEGGAGNVTTPFDWDKETPEDCSKAPVITPGKVITDVTRFKSSHALYPLPQPYIDFTGGTKSKL